jgi:DNA-binding LacI/PurR family transcriptional regulator
LVVVCGDLTAEGYPSVFIGERAIAGLAAEHLLSLGHRRIGCFCPPGSRRDAFRAAIPGDRIRAEWIVAPAGSVDDNVRRLSELLRRRERPTAIFAYSDVDAALCLKAAVRGGVRVPGELSVLGSDDLPLATLVEPELSTVRQPKFEQGAEAYALLKRVMQGASSVGQVVLKAELVQRGSTGRPDVA